MNQICCDQIPAMPEGKNVGPTGWLYLIANASASSPDTDANAAPRTLAVVAGYTGGADQEILDLSPNPATRSAHGWIAVSAMLA